MNSIGERIFYIEDLKEILDLPIGKFYFYIRKNENEVSRNYLNEKELLCLLNDVYGTDFVSIDTLTNLWLRENDPYFRDTRTNKRKKLLYSYETPDQIKYRKSKEIPISSLFMSLLYVLRNQNYDVDSYLKNLATE